MKHRAALLLILLSAVKVFADTPLDDYRDRLDQASSTIASLFDEDDEKPSDAQVVAALQYIRKLMRSEEDVTVAREKLRVDNAWMTESIDRLIGRYSERNVSDEQRYSDLVELAGRIVLLAQRVRAAVDAPVVAAGEGQRGQLESILAREEYQPPLHQESRLQKWISRMWAAFLRLLSKLVPEPSNPQTNLGRRSLDVVRIIITLGLLAALIIGIARLVRRLRVRRRRLEETDVGLAGREVLGEEIAEDATAKDMLAMAAELARTGDYRSAIRRTFIALLLELESRGKLRLDRAKTNYDYVNEIRPDAMIFGPVASMTNVFERVWYGQRGASGQDYAEFVAEFGKLKQ